MNKKIKRIAVLGPESTGKSTLCEQLSIHFNTEWVQEYAREYLSNLNRSYTIEDIIHIYKTQYEIEKEKLNKSNELIIVDTEFIIARVWCEHVFGECPQYIDEMITMHPYDLYLLTYPDLPWVDDPLRENPGKGEYFFNLYKKILEQNKMNFEIISGTEADRTTNAIEVVDRFCNQQNPI